MSSEQALCFKLASEAWEFDQIARLNYRTFVQEIPQHAPDPTEMLVDKFHPDNAYIVGLSGQRVLAMVAVRGQRPFSLDAKLPLLDQYLPAGRRLCEIRLLAVEPDHRRSRITSRLFSAVAEYCDRKGFDMAVISGTLRELHLYRHLGFVPFGPVVGTDAAPYQPMYLDARMFCERAPALAQPPAVKHGLNFLPGPVDVSERVRRAYKRPAISHRGREFADKLALARRRLCNLTRARCVQILAGPGTLANDVIAAQLSLRADRGVVVAQGEFGQRLVDHATRFGILGGTVRGEFGRPLDLHVVESELARHADIGWLWAVHCETSSGVLNDVGSLKQLCRQHGIDLCLDCISSIGTVPLDLSGVLLASASSGKGLASFAGLAVVFHEHPVHPSQRLPRLLDLGLYEHSDGVPFTVPSNPLEALLTALDEQSNQRYQAIARVGAILREGLMQIGLTLVADASCASPAVATVLLPQNLRAARFGRGLEAAGISVAHRSHYLRQRNAVQFCLMGHQPTDEQVRELLGAVHYALQSDRTARRDYNRRIPATGAKEYAANGVTSRS